MRLQVVSERADGGGDGHLVVVEDNEQVRLTFLCAE